MTQATLESLIIHEVATEGIISRIKGRIDLKKFRKAHGAEIQSRADEIQEMEPKEAAKVALNAAIRYNTDVEYVKKPTTNHLDVFYEEHVKNPGNINQTKTVRTTLNGYDVLICTRMDKATGKEKFSHLCVTTTDPESKAAGEEAIEMISSMAAANMEALVKYSFKST